MLCSLIAKSACINACNNTDIAIESITKAEIYRCIFKILQE
jgi:hypothetical protein